MQGSLEKAIAMLVAEIAQDLKSQKSQQTTDEKKQKQKKNKQTKTKDKHVTHSHRYLLKHRSIQKHHERKIKNTN